MDEADELCPDCQTVHDQLRTRLAVVEAQRDAAQKDAKDARALLGDIKPVLAKFWVHRRSIALCARIEAMLEQKP